MMVFSAFVGVVSFAEEEAAPAAELRVSQANLEFGNAVYLYIAVDYAEFKTADDKFDPAGKVTLKITNNKTGESVVLSPSSKIATPTNTSVAFKYISLGAKNIGDELTIQALMNGVASGEAKTYSVLEYALKASAQGDAKLAALMDAMLEYGADAQDAWEHDGTYDLSKEWGMVVSPNATVAKSILEKGKTATLVSKDASKTVLYTTGFDRVSDNPTFTVTESYQSLIFVNESMLTNFYFDFDNYTGETITTESKYPDPVNTTSSKITYYSTKTAIAVGSKTGMTDPVGLSVNSGTLSAANNDGGYRTISNGSLQIVTGAHVGFDANVSPAPSGFASEGKFTVTFSIKKVEGMIIMGGPRLRVNAGKDGAPPAERTEIYLYGASGDKIYLGGTGSGVVLGTCTTDEYLTFHIVVDVEAGMFYGYDASGNLIGSCSATVSKGSGSANFVKNFGAGAEGFKKFMSYAPWFNWSIAKNRGVELNKYILTKGNIFE